MNHRKLAALLRFLGAQTVEYSAAELGRACAMIAALCDHFASDDERVVRADRRAMLAHERQQTARLEAEKRKRAARRKASPKPAK